jgi:hypothetical protein
MGKWRWETARLEKENVWWPGVCGDGEAGVEKGKPVLWPAREKNPNQGGGYLVRDRFRFRFRIFFAFFFKITFFFLCMCWKLLSIGKNIVWSSNLVPQLFFL